MTTNVIYILRDMERRIPWRVANKILRRCGLSCGHGWESTVEKLRGKKKNKSIDLDALMDAFAEHHECGEKSFRIYRATKKQLNSIRGKLTSEEAPKSIFSNRFPLLLSEADLQKSSEIAPTLVEVSEDDMGITALYSSVRTIDFRTAQKPQDLPPNVRAFFKDYQEIILIEKRRVQLFDAIWISKSNSEVEIRVDIPMGATTELIISSHARMLKVLEALAGGSASFQRRNLFPLIEKIYNAKGEGSVIELAFGTDTASLKHEKMRKHRLCLRSEKYHVGGKAAVSNKIYPYKMGVSWEFEHDEEIFSMPELFLNGNSRLLHATTPELYDAEIRRCLGFEDYMYVRGRVDEFLDD